MFIGLLGIMGVLGWVISAVECHVARKARRDQRQLSELGERCERAEQRLRQSEGEVETLHARLITSGSREPVTGLPNRKACLRPSTARSRACASPAGGTSRCSRSASSDYSGWRMGMATA